MRLWSVAKTQMEIKRDMTLDTTGDGARGLMVRDED